MTGETNTTGVVSSVIRPAAKTTSDASPDWTTWPFVSDVLAKLPPRGPRFVACAPGRLDVLGGSAEYSGCLIVGMPLAKHTCVAVAGRSDEHLSITSTLKSGSGDQESTTIPLSVLQEAEHGSFDAGRLKTVSGDWSTTVRCVLGTLVEMRRSRITWELNGGLSIALGSTLSELSDAGSTAALAAATLVAVAGACDLTVDHADAVALCQRVENVWLQVPVGVCDAACTLLGEPGALAHFHGEPFARGGTIQLPDGLALIGIDSGVTHPEAKQKYARVRTASCMGRTLVERIARHEGDDLGGEKRLLSRVGVTAYVERFRDRLPTKLKGREYLDRFGETGDPLTRIEPDFVYKVRSRTEHHIYEHARACRFVECLQEATRRRSIRAMQEAGELMYASHWSYGQRCGLGSVETDLLVSLIRQRAGNRDRYGAKITGRGCGGVVAVLMRATDRAWETVHTAMDTYEKRTGRKPRLLRGSSAGAMVRGAVKV